MVEGQILAAGEHEDLESTKLLVMVWQSCCLEGQMLPVPQPLTEFLLHTELRRRAEIDHPAEPALVT